MIHPLVIEAFDPTQQQEVKTLILAGLEERWGRLDPDRNPDLNDIAASYAQGDFLVATLHGRVVGCGACIPHAPGVGEIVRMSVATDMRRHGIGRAILKRLRARAYASGIRRLVLETTATWHDAILFYQRHGFAITHEQDGDVYLVLDLMEISQGA